ncbi:unnamed protein product [Blepharisma stoltei]|uniref:Uncharacterized protein n=1 Tax=Blepharisma stoltei TaxID=1481888 RepID=A0AAU9IS17_9CILI|nr:unnamed protein product [Blepharisma stoltei]
MGCGKHSKTSHQTYDKISINLYGKSSCSKKKQGKNNSFSIHEKRKLYSIRIFTPDVLGLQENPGGLENNAKVEYSI